MKKNFNQIVQQADKELRESAEPDQEIQADENLLNELNNVKWLAEQIDLQGDRDSIKAIRAKMLENKNISTPKAPTAERKASQVQLFVKYAAAAVITLFIGASVIIGSLDSKSLYEESIEPLKIFSFRGENDLSVLLTAFQDNNWEKVITADANTTEDFILQGYAHLQMNNATEAVRLFEKAKDLDTKGEYINTLQWYTSLAYVQQGDTENSLKSIETLRANTNNPYNQEISSIWLMKLKAIHLKNQIFGQ